VNFDKKLDTDKAIPLVFDYCLDRLSAYYSDQNIDVDVIQSVLAIKPSIPVDLNKRVHAVNAFMALPAAKSLAAANKRSGNILKKIKGELPSSINEKLLSDDAERRFYSTLKSLSDKVQQSIKASEYEQALNQLAELREPVDAFFDNVMVMDDDEAVRNNRIALLNNLRGLFMQIADLSKL